MRTLVDQEQALLGRAQVALRFDPQLFARNVGHSIYVVYGPGCAEQVVSRALSLIECLEPPDRNQLTARALDVVESVLFRAAISVGRAALVV